MELGAESETNNINLHIDAVNIKQLIIYQIVLCIPGL